MDLFWVIYFADISFGFKAVFAISAALTGFGFFLTFMESLERLNQSFSGTKEDQNERKTRVKSQFKKACALMSIPVFLGFLAIVIPSEKAIYMMAGVESAQRIAEKPETKEIGEKILKILNQKLDDALEDKSKKEE